MSQGCVRVVMCAIEDDISISKNIKDQVRTEDTVD